MNSEELKRRVSDLISQARTKQAMDLLWEHAPSIQDELIQLISRFNDNERRNRLGLLRRNEYTVENNRIVSALLEVMKILEQSTSTDSKANIDSDRKNDSSDVQKILFLASNPRESRNLQLGKEFRDVEYSLLKGKHRDKFSINHKSAVREKDLRFAILNDTPQFLHFSGHGYSSKEDFSVFIELVRGARPKNRELEEVDEEIGIILEDDSSENGMLEVSHNALAGLFSLFQDDIKCVFLNACYSSVQAEAISKHIPYVIGYKEPISDETAIKFAVSFYEAVAAGKDIPFAFKYAKASVGLGKNAGEKEKAVLLVKK